MSYWAARWDGIQIYSLEEKQAGRGQGEIFFVFLVVMKRAEKKKKNPTERRRGGREVELAERDKRKGHSEFEQRKSLSFWSKYDFIMLCISHFGLFYFISRRFWVHLDA